MSLLFIYLIRVIIFLSRIRRLVLLVAAHSVLCEVGGAYLYL